MDEEKEVSSEKFISFNFGLSKKVAISLAIILIAIVIIWFTFGFVSTLTTVIFGFGLVVIYKGIEIGKSMFKDASGYSFLEASGILVCAVGTIAGLLVCYLAHTTADILIMLPGLAKAGIVHFFVHAFTG